MVDRRAFRTSHPRHASTRLAAVLLCAGLGVTSAPHAMAAPNDGPNSVASLANDLTQAQKKLTELQNEQGGIRQEANKTVYELDEATSDANDAQEKVVQARARLDKSQKDVEEAQDKLNSLSRSQYTQGQDSNAVTMAAGEDAVANTLDRASYLRTEAAKQRKVVSQLDKVRTQAANEESSLRKLLADASAKRKDAKESKDKALEAIQTASRKAADLQKSIQEAEARKNEIQSRLDEVKGDKAGSSSNSPSASAQSNASDTSAAGPSTSASATQDTKPASDSASPADNAADNQDNSSDSASSDDQSSASSAPTTEQLAHDTSDSGDQGIGESTQESTEPSSDATEQPSSNEPATASAENSAQDSAQNDQADSSSRAENVDDQGAKADQGIDYAAADQTEKERSEAAADAKQKADNALAAAKDAKEKEDNGDPTVEQARQNAANLATIASEAVKRVEELTEKLRQILGAAFDSSSNDADKALIGLTSSGLAALAAGLKAGQEGNDPVAAAVNGGRQAARQAWDQIQNQSDNSGSNASNTGSANTGSGSASTATGTTCNGTGSDNSGSTASGSSSPGSDNSSNDQSSSSTSSGSTGSTSTDTDSDGSDSDDESTSTTSQLVNGLKNNSDALNRVTDGTDQASLATSIGGGNSANSSTTGTTNTGDNAQTATSGSAETRINAVIARAQSQLGVRYSWGGGNYYGPTVGIRDGGVADQYGDYAHAGFDCSGLVLYAFYIAGFKLPHYTGAQYQSGTQHPASQMKRGDLIFYGPNASQHVAIYLGNDQMIEAPESGSVVKISPVRYGGMTPNVVRLIS